jgi:hypothetical protein
MKLKLSDWASLAEVIGAIAIVVSLIYVGIQVNDSALAVRSATANETSAAISSWYSELGTSIQATDVFVRGIANPESLTSSETAQFIYLTHGLFFQYQGAFYLAEEGTLDSELQQSLVNTLLGVREQPGFLMYWEQRGTLFQPGFREFVDDLIANGDTNTNLEQIYRDAASD